MTICVPFTIEYSSFLSNICQLSGQILCFDPLYYSASSFPLLFNCSCLIYLSILKSSVIFMPTFCLIFCSHPVHYSAILLSMPPPPPPYILLSSCLKSCSLLTNIPPLTLRPPVHYSSIPLSNRCIMNSCEFYCAQYFDVLLSNISLSFLNILYYFLTFYEKNSSHHLVNICFPRVKYFLSLCKTFCCLLSSIQLSLPIFCSYFLYYILASSWLILHCPLLSSCHSYVVFMSKILQITCPIVCDYPVQYSDIILSNILTSSCAIIWHCPV